MPFFAPSYCHFAHPWTKSTQSYTYVDRSQSYCAPCHGGCPCPLCHSQGGGPCFCSTMASWSPVIFCSAEVVIPSTSSTPVVSMSTHYIMATWSFMGITIASLPLLHGPWSHPLLHSPDPLTPQSKPANAPRMLSSLPLFPSLSHYFTAQVCYRSIAQCYDPAHITVMYITKLPWVRFKSSKLAYSAHILQSDCTSSDDDTVDAQMTTQGRGWMIAIRKVIACPFQIIDLVFSDLSPSIFDAHFCRVTMECVSPGQVAIPPQHSLTD